MITQPTVIPLIWKSWRCSSLDHEQCGSPYSYNDLQRLILPFRRSFEAKVVKPPGTITSVFVDASWNALRESLLPNFLTGCMKRNNTWFSVEHVEHCRTKTSDMQMGTSVADAITSRSCTMSIWKPIKVKVWPGWNYGMVSSMDHVEFTMIGDHSSSSTLCNPCFNCPYKLMDIKAPRP